MRLCGIDEHSLRTDEIYILTRAEGTTAEVLGRVRETVMGAPMEFLIRRGVLVFSDQELWLRFPDALAGTVTSVVTWMLGRRLFDGATGFLAAVLLALSPMHVAHSQDARYYAAFCLVGAVSSLLFLRAVQRRSAGAWFAYCASLTAGLYTCYLMVVLAAGHALYLLGPFVVLRHWSEGVRKSSGFLAALAVAGLALAPWVLLHPPAPNVPYAPVGLFRAIRDLSTGFAGGTGWVEAAYWGLGLAGFMLAWERDRSSARFCVLILAASFFLIWTLDYFFSYFFAVRQMIFALPLFLILVAHGAVRTSQVFAVAGEGRRRWTGLILTAVAVILGGAALREIRDHRVPYLQQEDWRGASRYLIDHMQPGEILVMPHLPFAPPEGDNATWYLRHRGSDPPPYRIVEATLLDARALRALAQSARVWVLVSEESRRKWKPELRAELETAFHREASFAGGLLYRSIGIYRSR